MIVVYNQATRDRVKQRQNELLELPNKNVLTFDDFTFFDLEHRLNDKRLLSLFVSMGKRTGIKSVSVLTYPTFVKDFGSFNVLVPHNNELYLVRSNLNKYIKSVKNTASAYRLQTLKLDFDSMFKVVDKIEDIK